MIDKVLIVILNGTIFGFPFPKSAVDLPSQGAAGLSKSDCSFHTVLIVLDSLLHGCLKSLKNLSRDCVGNTLSFLAYFECY